MEPGAVTPEELETLLEDAFVTRDAAALAHLFDDGALLVADGSAEARGAAEIGRFAEVMWQQGRTYLADSERILQARDTALLVAEGAHNVARRGNDGTWRFAILLLAFDPTAKEEQ